MEMTFPTIALIVAASQSLLLTILIFQKHRALFANRFLAALMLCFTVISVHLLLQDSGVYGKFPAAFLIVGLPLTASPLQFLYTKYLLRGSTRFSSGDWMHFSAFILFEGGLIGAYLFGFVDFAAAITSEPASAPLYLRLFNLLLIAQGLFYAVWGLRLISRFNARMKNVHSSVEKIQMDWLRNTTAAMLSAWALFLVEDTLMTWGVNLSNFVLVSIVFAVYVYAMGLAGLMKSEIFASPDVEKTMHEITAITETAGGEETTVPKYEKSGLSADAADRIVTQLLDVMERKKPFTDPLLTLPQLADMIGVTPHNLLEVINSRLRKNFYDLVNGYRIEQVKRDLVSSEKSHLKILSVAFDAGFNSKATFNTLFKENTGVTPSDYRKSTRGV